MSGFGYKSPLMRRYLADSRSLSLSSIPEVASIKGTKRSNSRSTLSTPEDFTRRLVEPSAPYLGQQYDDVASSRGSSQAIVTQNRGFAQRFSQSMR